MVRRTRRLAIFATIFSLISTAGLASQAKLSPFMITGGKTSQPIGHYEFCLTHGKECAAKATGELRMRLTPERWNELVAVNNGINTRIAPATDEELYGRAEFWTYPSTRGDCEDLVL